MRSRLIKALNNRFYVKFMLLGPIDRSIGDPAYIIGKFVLINCKTLYIFVRMYGLIIDAIPRLGSIRIKINTQKKVDKY